MNIRQDLISSIQESQQRQRAITSAMTVVENLRDELDPQMKGWGQIGGKGDLPPEVNSDPSLLRKESIRAFYQEPYGKVIIRNMVKFIIGSGTIINWEEKNEPKLQSLLKWWKKSAKSVKWFTFQREYVTRFFRDGEVFVRKFTLDNEPLRLRFVDPQLISDNGIITDSTDVQTVLTYIISREGNIPEEVPASEIHHLKNADANMKRGRPILEAVLPYIAKYKKWMDARMVLNIVRASVAIVQEVAGTSTDLLRLSSKQRANSRTNDTDRTKMLQPGSIIRGTPGVKYNMLSPNLDAKDASEDGRTIQLAMAAGAGFPDTFVTGDYSKSNFASSVVAQNPAIREFEDGQQLIAEGIVEIVDWILIDGLEKKQVVVGASLDYELGFPPLLKRDLAQETAAYEIQHNNRVISRATWQIVSGLDPDAEDRKIEDDDLSLMNKPPEVSLPKAEPPSKKRVDDRKPRQSTAGNEGTISAKNKLIRYRIVSEKKDADDEAFRNYEVEYDVVRPEQSPNLSGDLAA